MHRFPQGVFSPVGETHTEIKHILILWQILNQKAAGAQGRISRKRVGASTVKKEDIETGNSLVWLRKQRQFSTPRPRWVGAGMVEG